MPQELTNAQGQVIWQASYKTWGSTVAEEWEVKTLAGNPVHKLDEGDSPAKADQQQNLRFQGQYLDRDTGLHYNTFRYYDPDVGRFICPDPIGLAGGINLWSYAPNPLMWIDPLGQNAAPETAEEWEKRFSKIPPGEKPGAAKGKLAKVANRNGWELDPKLSRQNGRDIYKTPDGDYRAADTQHGRFEKLDKRGKHMGEINIDGKPIPNSTDKSGGHDIKC